MLPPPARAPWQAIMPQAVLKSYPNSDKKDPEIACVCHRVCSMPAAVSVSKQHHAPSNHLLCTALCHSALTSLHRFHSSQHRTCIGMNARGPTSGRRMSSACGAMNATIVHSFRLPQPAAPDQDACMHERMRAQNAKGQSANVPSRLISMHMCVHGRMQCAKFRRLISRQRLITMHGCTHVSACAKH